MLHDNVYLVVQKQKQLSTTQQYFIIMKTNTTFYYKGISTMLILFVFSSIINAQLNTIYSANQRGSLNVGYATHYDPAKMLAEKMFFAPGFHYNNPWRSVPLEDLDANGYPKVGITSVLLVFQNAPNMQGIYDFSCDGRATLANFLANVSISAYNYNSTTNKTTATITIGKNNFPKTYQGRNAPNVDNYNLQFNVTAVTSLNNMSIRQAGRAGKITSAEFEAAINYMNPHTLRFMTALNTNGNIEKHFSQRIKTKPIRSIQSRTSPYSVRVRYRQTGGNGAAFFDQTYNSINTSNTIPYEMIVQICNELDKNAWICLPALSTDDYITKTIKVMKNGSDGVNPYENSYTGTKMFSGLESGRKLIVEFGNELWNSNFYDNKMNNMIATGWDADFPNERQSLMLPGEDSSKVGAPRTVTGFIPEWVMSSRRVVKQTVNIANILRQVYGTANVGINKTAQAYLPWQVGGNAINDGLRWYEHYYNDDPLKNYAHCGGGACYYGPSFIPLTVAGVPIPVATESTWRDNYWMNTSFWINNLLKRDLTLARTFGIPYIAYEGGLNLGDEFGGADNANAVDLRISIYENNAAVRAECNDHVNELYKLGACDIAYYELGSDLRWGYGGKWGYDITDFNNGKVQSVVDGNATAKPTVDQLTLGKYFTNNISIKGGDWDRKASNRTESPNPTGALVNPSTSNGNGLPAWYSYLLNFPWVNNTRYLHIKYRSTGTGDVFVNFNGEGWVDGNNRRIPISNTGSNLTNSRIITLTGFNWGMNSIRLRTTTNLVTIESIELRNYNGYRLAEEESIESPVYTPNIEIFPNPSTESSEVFVSEEPENIEMVQVLDMNGKIVYSNSYNNIIKTQTLPKGIYFVYIKLATGLSFHKKLVIE